jgi:error-prone DNA polymerase
MEQLRGRLYSGMASRGIVGAVADQIYDKLLAFANFGFPESHSVSFAYLVYSSSWMKYHYPAAFTAGLLDGQPMGFWSPQTLVADARRHGVVVLRPDVNASSSSSSLEPCPSSAGGAAVRLGLDYVRHVGRDMAAKIAAGRPYADMEDLVRRTGLSTAAAEALATAGALSCFPGKRGPSRREALWEIGALAQSGPALEAMEPSIPGTPARSRGRRPRRPVAALSVAAQSVESQPVEPQPFGVNEVLSSNSSLTPKDSREARPRVGRLPGLVTGAEAPSLPDMTAAECNRADLWATGVSPDSYPTEFIRTALDKRGIVTAAGLVAVPDRARVTVAGIVTHRQRPATAQGTIFINLEDETGLINVIVSAGAWARFRRVARSEPALVIRGTVEKVDGVVNLIAEHIEALSLSTATIKSRDFR